MNTLQHFVVVYKVMYLYFYSLGELSEGQKQEVEKYKEMMGNKEREVIEMRQQLAKLSRIIDKQKEELKTIEQELR